ncbi:hypothetical protein ACF07T_41650, partial [Streptomyces sp. NPDC015184]
MPSVVGLLEQHELAARRRVDGLREEADRIQAELAAAVDVHMNVALARFSGSVAILGVGSFLIMVRAGCGAVGGRSWRGRTS